jgi:hypothetical protein
MHTLVIISFWGMIRITFPTILKRTIRQNKRRCQKSQFEREKTMQEKKEPKKPIENHKSAAWSDIKNINEISKTSHPSENQTIDAKEYVDTNEK